MDQTANPFILQTQLEAYARQGPYPFHMPGHKRRMKPAPGLPAEWDVTEVPGTDDLHDASGILREAMERTARLWGADRTWYLVNGSTCGLLAGIRAMAPRGSEILCARNCHKAVYHAIELAGYRVHWILPEIDGETDVCKGIRADQVLSAVRRHPSVRAVILTSPTYEGILSEVGEICRIAHARDIPVLVDEAHGAHLLPMAEKAGFPAGALSAGADLVVQSPHKTLPSLTQTALLHLQGRLVDAERVEAELDIFETSSPSYPLLASLDGCTGILRTQGPDLFAAWADRLAGFDTAVRSLQRLRVLYRQEGGRKGAGRLYDPGKILIDARQAAMTGRELAGLLRERYGIETEYAQGGLVLAMTSPCDREDALEGLARALVQIDLEAAERSANDMPAPAPSAAAARTRPSPVRSIPAAAARIRPCAACPIAEAAGREAEPVPVSLAAGRVCAEYLYFYPPGIPFLAPGEIVSRAHVELLQAAAEPDPGDGTVVAAVYRHAADHRILCLCE